MTKRATLFIMLTFLKKKYPFFFFLIFFLIFFRKVIFLGLMPIPSDLLVSFYFPFSSGGFSEYSPWVPNKAQVADDSLRQQYPWKLFSAGQIKKGELPLWNPYAFSGYPLYANVQTAVFYPPNLLFALIDPKLAWTILILIQPVLASYFMYLFLRSLKISQLGATFGALIFANMSFEMFWQEQMIIGHTTLWLPLILLSLQKISEGQKKWFILGLLGLILSILGGYSQTTLYVFIISFFFLVIKIFSFKERKYQIKFFFIGCFMFLLALGICAVQLIPTAEIYQYSAREGQFSQELYIKSLAPPRNILTLFSSDFFGNMATHNYWGDQHTDFNHFFGCIPLLISLSGLYLAWKYKVSLKEGGPFFALGIVAWLFSLTTPFGFLPGILHIPILSTGVVARFLFVFQFSMSVVSAFSLDNLLKNKNLKFSLKPSFFLFLLCLLTSGFLYLIIKTSFDKDIIRMYTVSFRNLVLSTIIFGFGFGILFLLRRNFLRNILIWSLIVVTAIEFVYLGNKYLPIAKKEYLFPKHPLFTYLQKIAGIDKVWGQGTAYLTTNFPTVYSLHYTDGYDSLFIKRYGELVYASRNGKIPEVIPRSDVNFSPNKESWAYKERMMDLLGIKYVLDKNDLPKGDFEPEPWKFYPDRYKLIWQNGKFKVYQNLKAWPRIYFAKDLTVKTQNQDIVDYLLQKKGNNLAVVEENLPGNIYTDIKSRIDNIKYTPNKINLEVKTDKDSFLVLTDNYYPGWKALINGRETKIYRTNYTFRGIIIPPGQNNVEFIFQPQSLKIGFIISVISLILALIVSIIFIKQSIKKQLHQ